MKPLKIVFISDTHLGLRVEGNDQTLVIENVIMVAVSKAIELQEEGYDVLLVFGGDIFDNNDPSEFQIGAFIRVLSVIKEHDIKTMVMVGNHEAKANPERLSCLSFIKDASVGFPSVQLIEDIYTMDYGLSVSGRLNLTFLPHISKATVERAKYKGTPQEYIDEKCEKILKKVQRNLGDHIVFSHLNVTGAHAGSEENLLKRSDVYLPKCFTTGFLVGIKPTIVQAHIHTRQQIDNIHVIGSPVFCSFGESGEKGFAVFTVGKSVGEEFGIEYFPSFAPEFIELELDMIGKNEPFFKIPEVLSALKELKNKSNFVLKVDVTINPENNSYDWKKIHSTLEHNWPEAIIKTIIPRIVSKRLVRNDKQKIGLTPDQAVQAFVKSNWKSNKELAKSIYKTAKNYL